MAELYLHIGTPKTGTTSIQNFLADNAAELKKEGICFPYIDLPFPREKFRSRRNGHFLVYHSKLEGKAERTKEEREFYGKGFRALQKEAKGARKVILSDEAIWYRQKPGKGFWQKLAEDAGAAGMDRVKVVVYLRRQDEFIQAEWNQSVKYYPRLTCSFSEFIKSQGPITRRLDYYAVLSKIAGAIGKENLIVRIYEKERLMGSREGIFGDFLEAVSEERKENYRIPEADFNQSLGGNYIEIKRLMNRSPSYQKMQDFLEDPIIHANAAGGGKEKESFFSHEERTEYLKQFEESNARVAREFLERPDGRLFSEPEDCPPRWSVRTEKMYEDMILAFTEAAASQEARIEELEHRVSDLEWRQKPIYYRAGRKARDKAREWMDGDAGAEDEDF